MQQTKGRNERAEAIRQLRRIARDGAYRAAVGQDSPPKTVEIVATVTRWRRWIDFLLSRFYHGNIDRLEPTVAEILRAGVCELAILGTPGYATVNTYAGLARTMVRREVAALVNAVLRSVSRQIQSLPEPHTGKPIRDLAIRWSHPTWMVRRYVKRFGMEETKTLLQANNSPPAHFVRVNRLKLSILDFEQRLANLPVAFKASQHLADYYQVSRLGPLIREGMLREGLCAIQDQSAGLVVDLLEPQPGESILDACAAPGGKTCFIAMRTGDSGTIQAWDRHSGRLSRLIKAANAQGCKSISADCKDLRETSSGSFDRVLVDVPCSGTGVLAKRADLRWRKSLANLNELVELQDALIDAASRHVRPGGTLVYSTCSIEPEENEHRIAEFLGRNTAFRLIPATRILPQPVVSSAGYLATLPHVHGIDGAFAARMQRT